MWNPLLAEGKIGHILLTAWIAKESLRNLLALARTGADRHRIGHARWKFLTRCADTNILEVRQLAVTVDRLRSGFRTPTPLGPRGDSVPRSRAQPDGIAEFAATLPLLGRHYA
jgi:hypothetical protein